MNVTFKSQRSCSARGRLECLGTPIYPWLSSNILLFHRLARPFPAKLNQEKRLPGRVLDAKDFTERHLFERKNDLGFGRDLVVDGINIVYQPIHFRLARAGQRCVAGDRKIFELDERRGLTFDLEPHNVYVETPGCLDVGYIFQDKAKYGCVVNDSLFLSCSLYKNLS